MKMWLRQVELIIGDKEWIRTHNKGIEIGFDIKKKVKEDKIDGGADLSTITLTNLSPDSVNSIKKGQSVVLNAGYSSEFGSNVGNLLVGQVAEVFTIRRGLDKITEVKVLEGGNEWRSASISQTYQMGTTASYIMRDIANIMGYEVSIIQPTNDIEYKLGRSINGKCSTILQQLVRDTNSKMYIDNNRLTIAPKNVGVENGFILKASTGLLDSPETSEQEDEQGLVTTTYSVNSKLNHELVLDSYIIIESETANGTFRITEVNHRDNFTTNLQVVEV